MNKVFWLFGRSGAGKSTLAHRLKGSLSDRKIPIFLLEGDAVREGLCRDLGFTPEARIENHRRIAEVARIISDASINTLVATMAPQYAQRDIVKKVLGNRLVWIFIDAPLETCIRRDPKGLYSQAREGHLRNLIEYPFDTPRPDECDLTVNTAACDIEACHHLVRDCVMRHLSDFAI